MICRVSVNRKCEYFPIVNVNGNRGSRITIGGQGVREDRNEKQNGAFVCFFDIDCAARALFFHSRVRLTAQRRRDPREPRVEHISVPQQVPQCVRRPKNERHGDCFSRPAHRHEWRRAIIGNSSTVGSHSAIPVANEGAASRRDFRKLQLRRSWAELSHRRPLSSCWQMLETPWRNDSTLVLLKRAGFFDDGKVARQSVSALLRMQTGPCGTHRGTAFTPTCWQQRATQSPGGKIPSHRENQSAAGRRPMKRTTKRASK